MFKLKHLIIVILFAGFVLLSLAPASAAPILAPKNLILVAKNKKTAEIKTAGAKLASTEVNHVDLLDIYRQSISNDPVLASALSANQAAQEIIEQGRALYRPVINFSAGASTSTVDVKYNGGSNPFKSEGSANFQGYHYGFDARQPIYRKQSLLQIDQAKTQASQSDKQLNLSKQDLIVRVTQGYFDVLMTQDRVDLIAAQKAAILSQLEQAKARFEVGAATVTDMNEAQARYDLILSQELSAVSEQQIAQLKLQAITGKIHKKLAPVNTNFKPNDLQQNMDKWLEVADKNNLNIQIQQDILKFSDQEIERLRAGHLPTLDALASITDTYSNGSANGFGSDLKNGTLSLQLQIPLYEGGATSSKVRQAVINRQKVQDDVELTMRQTALNTQSAFLNLNTSIVQIKALEKALLSSQSQVESSKLGYEVGVRTSVDVLNAEQQFFSAKRDFLQARYQYLVNIIRLKAVAGALSESDVEDINQQLVQK